MTMHGLWERWMLVKGLNLAKTTLSNYDWHIRTHLGPDLGERTITSVTEADILRYINTKLVTLSRNTVSQQVTILHQALAYAVEHGLLSHSPCAGIRLGARPRQIAKVLDTTQVQTFLKEAWRSRYYPIYVLAIYTGLRRSELIGLRWEDVEWENSVLHIREAIVRLPTSSTWITKEPKSRTSRRSVEVPPIVLQVLRPLYDRRTTAQIRILSHPDGRRWPIDHIVGYDLPRICQRAGLPGLRLHDLRHTHATLLLKMKFSPRAVQERLGHSNVAFTLTIYGHVLPGTGKEMAIELENRLSEVSPSPTSLLPDKIIF